MKTPIEQLLDTVDWQEGNPEPDDSGLPYATHKGVLELFGVKLRCYRLNDGRALFHADDFHALLNMMDTTS